LSVITYAAVAGQKKNASLMMSLTIAAVAAWRVDEDNVAKTRSLPQLRLQKCELAAVAASKMIC
jgi:hypothetical protein